MVITNKNTKEKDEAETKNFIKEYNKGAKAIVDKNYTVAVESFKHCVDDILKKISQQARREPTLKTMIHIAYYQMCQIIAGSIGLNPDREKFTEEETKALRKGLEYLSEALELDPLNETYRDLYRIVTIYICYFETTASECLKLMQRLVMVQPYSILAQYNIGYNYQRLNVFDKAIEHYKMCLSIIEKDEVAKNREYDEEQCRLFRIKCYNGLGSIYFYAQHKELCKYYFEKAYELDPDDPDINNQIAVVYTDLRLSEKAIFHYKKGIENYEKAHISVDGKLLLASMYMNMGLMYTYSGDIMQGIEYYNESLRHKPGYSLAYQNKLLDINYLSHKVDPLYIAKIHKQIDRCFKVVYKSWMDAPHLKDYKCKVENKKLRIGFMSGDFICHPVSYFTSGILDNLDQNTFEIYCYSTKVIKVDDRYPNCKWFCVKGAKAEVILKLMVETHKLDILVDLSGNTGENRMDVLALKPAPMIISMIGYPNTTGLSSVDYKLTDYYADPKEAEEYYSEKLLRMGGSFLCYTPSTKNGQLPELEETGNRHTTFGCFNRFNKLSDTTVETWCEILNEIEDSRLVLKTKEFASEEIVARLTNVIDNYEKQTGNKVSHKIELLDYKDTYDEHLLDYNKIDIALDTFPYAGTTTTCEALMMGVPVVTLRDAKTHVHAQNVGYSILSNCGLQNYVTETRKEYIDFCVKLARGEKTRKSEIRSKFTKSIVYDKKRYAAELGDLLVKGYHELFK